MSSLYRIHGGTPIAVTKEQATAIGEDIFLRASDVGAWVVDVDGGTPAQQRAAIKKAPLVPSFVVEGRTSHQVHYAAKHPRREAWDTVVLDRLAPSFHGSGVRLDGFVRKPGYLDGRQLVRVVWRHAVSYTEAQIARVFPAKPRAPVATVAVTPLALTSLVPDPRDEEIVIGAALQGLLYVAPALEMEHFVSPARWVFAVARDLESKGVDVTPSAAHGELARSDAERGTFATARWSLAALQQLASIPVPIEMLIDAVSRLTRAQVARSTALDLDVQQARAEDEVTDLAMRDAAMGAAA